LHDGRVLVIFPEGELRPAGPLGPLAGGAAWYARVSGTPLVAVAVRTVMRGHQAAEAYVSLSAVPPSTSLLAAALSSSLSSLDDELLKADPRQPLDGFRCAVRGKRSWDERLA
jgi:1-acyl-sn-glycerol-3-phosphate acyltransferase